MDLGDIPAWIALALSIVSLLVQYRSNLSAERKERASDELARLEHLESTVAEIRATALAYWLYPESTSAKEGLMLTHLLKSLSGEVQRSAGLLWDQAWRDVLQLKMDMTGADFQQLNRPARPANDPFVRAFSDKSTAFSENLRRRIEQVRDRAGK